MDLQNGIFIEAGANDGISQSNTYLFEKYFGWTGLLVEPNPIKFNECINNRPNSIVENFALVSFNYNKETIVGDFNQENWGESLSGCVQDSGDWTDDSLEHERNLKMVHNANNMIEVQVTTINSLLKKHNFSNIDFFSLDVEGYEISVLGGLNFEEFRPKYMLIETTSDNNRKKIMNTFMNKRNYKLVTELSFNDCLYVDSNL